jgi:hypothetical protein
MKGVSKAKESSLRINGELSGGNGRITVSCEVGVKNVVSVPFSELWEASDNLALKDKNKYWDRFRVTVL